MDKSVDGEADYAATFEQTLQRFVGLSSEEIWELQRVLIRRVRCKISESLSPEGQTAMKEAQQETIERREELQKLGPSRTSLVTEIYSLAKEDPRENGESVDVDSRKLGTNGNVADDSGKSADDIGKSADDSGKSSENSGKLACDKPDEIDRISLENAIGGSGNIHGELSDFVKSADDNQSIADGKMEANENQPMESVNSESPANMTSEPEKNVLDTEMSSNIQETNPEHSETKE